MSDLLSTREYALVLESISSERTYWLEFLSSTVASQRWVVWFPVVIITRSVMGEFGLVVVESAFVQISDTISSAYW